MAVYLVELNEYGVKSLSNSSPGRLLLRNQRRLRCSSVDQQGPLLLMNVVPPEGSKVHSEVEFQIPYEFVLYIATAVDDKMMGFLTSD